MIRFAWDADPLSVRQEDLDLVDPVMFKVSLNEQPLKQDRLSFRIGSKSHDFVFVNEKRDSNGTEVFVQLGEAVDSSLVQLSKAVEQADLGFITDRKKNHFH